MRYTGETKGDFGDDRSIRAAVNVRGTCWRQPDRDSLAANMLDVPTNHLVALDVNPLSSTLSKIVQFVNKLELKVDTNHAEIREALHLLERSLTEEIEQRVRTLWKDLILKN